MAQGLAFDAFRAVTHDAELGALRATAAAFCEVDAVNGEGRLVRLLAPITVAALCARLGGRRRAGGGGSWRTRRRQWRAGRRRRRPGEAIHVEPLSLLIEKGRRSGAVVVLEADGGDQVGRVRVVIGRTVVKPCVIGLPSNCEVVRSRPAVVVDSCVQGEVKFGCCIRVRRRRRIRVRVYLHWLKPRGYQIPRVVARFASNSRLEQPKQQPVGGLVSVGAIVILGNVRAPGQCRCLVSGGFGGMSAVHACFRPKVHRLDLWRTRRRQRGGGRWHRRQRGGERRRGRRGRQGAVAAVGAIGAERTVLKVAARPTVVTV
mmetsp:Transcript_9080/g.22546  ORF Transcript_9080/g.22546 Transcript_9080/m.22546 type:complete len:317 (+) Transcript_9080:212-1162(+)